MDWTLLRDDLRDLPTFLRIGSALRGASTTGRDTLGRLVRVQAERHPERVLLRFESETVTYGEFNAEANAWAAVFREAGIVARQPIALMMENSPSFLVAQAAAAKSGAVVALINTHLAGEALAHALRTSTARHIFADQRCLDAVVGLPDRRDWAVWGQGPASSLPPGVEPLDAAVAAAPRREPDMPDVRGGDVFLYIYTSGTTGMPKPAIIRHSRFTMAGIALGALFGIGDQDVVYAPLPLYHGESNFVGFSVALRAGAGFASRRRFSAAEFWDDVRRHGATMFVYVGELCRYLLRQPASSLDRQHRLRLAAGAGLRPDIWTEFQARFAIERIVEMYGLTEGNVSLMNRTGRTGSVGRPHPFQHGSVKLARYDIAADSLCRGKDGFLVECAAGESGELLGRLRHSGWMPYDGYTDPTATRSRIVENAFEPGDAYFRSGDLLSKDRDGYYYFVDRIGDTFRWKGENVATLEVAEILNRAADVAEVVVYGVPIPGADGRVGAAAVLLVPGRDFDAEGFYEYASRHLPAYARPGFVRLVSTIETTGTLKQRRVELQREGFDAAVIADRLFARDDVGRTYVPLTAEVIGRIRSGAWRL